MPARLFARINQVELYYRAKRYRELLTLASTVENEFPQLAHPPAGPGRNLEWYVQDAKKHLPQSTPVSTPS